MTLERRNNEIILERAKDAMRKCFGEPTEEDIRDIREKLFSDTWQREGYWFRKMRHQLYKTFSELSEELNIKEKLLYKLENGHDFKKRDEIARILEGYYKI
jgi:hypothetical protein